MGSSAINRLARSLAQPFGDADRFLYALRVRDLRRLRLPDYMGLGAAQSGSSWLHVNLLRHPDIEAAVRKEVRYWSHAPHRPLRYYATFFEHVPVEKMVGDISPDYAALPSRRIAQVRRLMPDLRLVYILRDPVQRDWAAIRRILSGRGGGRGFRRYDRRPIEDVSIQEMLAFLPNFLPSRHSRYRDNIARWAAEFTAPAILLIDFEDVRQRPRQVLADTFVHLGLDPSALSPAQYDAASRTVNANPPRPIPAAVEEALLEANREERRRLRELLEGWPTGHDWNGLASC